MSEQKAQKMINDYAEEYDDCMDILENELPKYIEYDEKLIKPKVGSKPKDIVSLFEEDEDEDFYIEDEWVDMPAFEANNMMYYKQLIVSFQTKDDMLAFAELVGRTITDKTKSIWYPQRETIASTLNRWIDEDELNAD